MRAFSSTALPSLYCMWARVSRTHTRAYTRGPCCTLLHHHTRAFWCTLLLRQLLLRAASAQESVLHHTALGEQGGRRCWRADFVKRLCLTCLETFLTTLPHATWPHLAHASKTAWHAAPFGSARRLLRTSSPGKDHSNCNRYLAPAAPPCTIRCASRYNLNHTLIRSHDDADHGPQGRHKIHTPT